MNRRRFLTTSATIIAAMAAGCARLAPQKDAAAAPPAAPAPSPLPSGGAPSVERPIRVAVLSDPHLQPDDSAAINQKLVKAAQDYKSMAPDLWLVNGDIADHGVSAELEAFKRIMGKIAPADRVLATTGNHEFYDMETTDDVSVARWKQAFGVQELYTSRVFGGVHFVMLADEQWKTAPYNKDWCWITPAQIAWFDRVLTLHRDRFTVVCMHQSLNETVSGSQGEKAFGGTNMAKEIYAILGRNPQVKLWFSGHTHRKLEVAGQVVEKNGVTFMNAGSTAYLVGPKPGGGTGRDADASQSRMLEIYPDRVRIMVRDHTAGSWMDPLELTVARA